jgi:hypothetical protein
MRSEHLKSVAGSHEEGSENDIWYLGEKLTGAIDTEWSASSTFGSRAAYLTRDGHFDQSTRRSVELMESWYRVPERVKVFNEGPLAGRMMNPADPAHVEAMKEHPSAYETVKFRMRLMLATKHAPCVDMASPFRHNRFLLVPIWGYRRARDGLAYGVWRGMRDIQDDLNKRRSKALWALSVNRIIADKGAVDDFEDLRQEAARPDAIIIKNQGRELTFDNNVGEFQGNLLLAEQDAQLMRNAGGVTNENLGRNTAAQSGKAIGLKQDQGSLTTSELFDNLLLAIKQVGKLRLSHIEQFYTDSKAVRIIGDGKPIEWLQVNRMDPATGEIMNDVTAREADFVVDTQDWRSSLARSQMEELFQLLGQMATFAPNVVMAVLDLVVDSTEIRDKAEWVARIRKLNGQRDPSKPLTEEEQKAEIAQAQKMQEQEQLASDMQKAALEKLQADIGVAEATLKKLDADGIMKKVETMYAALQAAQIVATVPGVTPAADEITASAGMRDEHPGAIPVPDQPPGAVMPQAGPLQGMQAGIQTPTGADNVIPNQPGEM